MKTYKNIMKKVGLSAIIFVMLSFPFIISAQTSANGTNSGGGNCGAVLCNPLTGNGSSDLGAFFMNLLNQLSKIAAMFAVLMIIWTGFKFVWARGNSSEIEKAKSQLLYVVIGTAIILGADVIINIVVNTIAGIKS